jgi:hypothetical protein
VKGESNPALFGDIFVTGSTFTESYSLDRNEVVVPISAFITFFIVSMQYFPQG